MKFFSIMILSLLVSCASTTKESTVVATKANEIKPLINGEKVPSALVENKDGKEVDLSKEILGKNTVVVFYRGGWCPYCNLQLQGLRKIEKELMDLGWEVVGISPDSAASLNESIKKHKLKYTLYSDSKVRAAIAFGLAFKVDDAMNAKLLGYGIDLEKASGQTHRVLPVPGVYMINKEGEVVFNYINPNYKVRLKESIILEAAKQLK